MRGRLLSLSLILALVSGCAVQTVSTPFIPEKSRLVGIWAMLPLRNGTANVAEYRADSKVYLHPFNCASKVEGEVEVSDYRLSDGGEWINISSSLNRFDLKVVRFIGSAMEVTMC